MAKFRCIQVIQYSSMLTIREFRDMDTERVPVLKPEHYYFRAVICGWRNFKFTTTTLKPQELLEKTLTKAQELKEELKRNPNSIETMPSLYIL